jgi:hypothetical protein
VSTTILILVFVVWAVLSYRSKKRRGEVVGSDGKKYELWDKDWESDQRIGDNCTGDYVPYYRGPDGERYLKREDGFHPADEIYYTRKEVAQFLSEARCEIRSLKTRVEELERKSKNQDGGKAET